jgi:hypothetical protein
VSITVVLQSLGEALSDHANHQPRRQYVDPPDAAEGVLAVGGRA